MDPEKDEVESKDEYDGFEARMELELVLIQTNKNRMRVAFEELELAKTRMDFVEVGRLQRAVSRLVVETGWDADKEMPLVDVEPAILSQESLKEVKHDSLFLLVAVAHVR